MPRRSSRQPAIPLPTLLTRIVRSAEAERARDAARSLKNLSGNHPATLLDLAQVVAVSLPARGVLAPGDELCNEIDRVAQRHLHRRDADRQFRSAMARVTNVEDRDAIETAHGRLVSVSEVAHYYAGLAAGITLAGLGKSR